MLQHAVPGPGEHRQRPRHRPVLPVLRRLGAPAHAGHRHGQAAARRRRASSELRRRPADRRTCRRSPSSPSSSSAGAAEAGINIEIAQESTRHVLRHAVVPGRARRPAVLGCRRARHRRLRRPPDPRHVLQRGAQDRWRVELVAVRQPRLRRRVRGVPELGRRSRPRRRRARRSRRSSTRRSRSGCRSSTTSCPATRRLPGRPGDGARPDVPARQAVAGLTRTGHDASGAAAASGHRVSRYILRRARALGRHAVPPRHDRLPDRQRLPDDPGRRSPDRSRRRRRSTRSTSASATNDPLLDQYGRLLDDTATFDFGDSFQLRQPVRRPAVAGPRPVGEARRLRARAHRPAGDRRRHVRGTTAQHDRRPDDRDARRGQLVDPRVRLRRDAAVPDRRQARLVRGAGAGAPRVRPAHRSSTTSRCRRWPSWSCTSATSPG